MDRIYPLIFFVFLLIMAFTFRPVDAQTSSYEIIPAPDLWYNDVDGIQIGARFRGEVPGTFEDGPHRLKAGIWLGLWFPDYPISYNVSYTEPISAWSEYGSEANIELVSSIRAGYHRHGAGFNKRWQQGFDERRYRELSFYFTYEKRFEHEYVQFPVLWSDDSKLLMSLATELQDDNRLGWYNLSLNGNLQYLDDLYGSTTFTAIQRIPFDDNWGLRFRGFLGIASTSAAPEYLFSRSNNQSVRWLNSRVTRAKGTIPQPWLTSGDLQVAGGANLRGYNSQDIRTFDVDEPFCVNCSNAAPFLFNSIASINAEFDYYNPINVFLNDLPYVAEFISFRSYLFLDAGRSLNLHQRDRDDFFRDKDTLFSNAGAGFSLSLNIPDYLGKQRGFVLRYEIPFWLSDPVEEDSFKWRNLFGFGAVVSF